MKKAYCSSRTGYTLVEVMIAMVAASLLIAGLSSTLLIATKSADASATPASGMIEGNAALRQMLSDLEFALTFSEKSATAFTFSVPDRDGDTNPETIRYAWSGTSGAPLTKEYNGGSAVNVVENVYSFQNDLPTPNANLLLNADMESGTTNWSAIPGATMYADGSIVNSGSQSLYAYRNSGSDESGIRQNPSSLTNGETYELGAWMRKWSAAQPYNVRLQLHIISSGAGDQVFTTETFLINNSSFLLVSGVVTPTWSGSLTAAYWEATGISNIQDIYVDDAYLRVKTSASQNLNVGIQVGSDARSFIQSGVALLNSPL